MSQNHPPSSIYSNYSDDILIDFPYLATRPSKSSQLVESRSLYSGYFSRKWMRFMGIVGLCCLLAYFHYLLNTMVEAIHIMRYDHHQHHPLAIDHLDTMTSPRIETDKALEQVETTSSETIDAFYILEDGHMHSPHHSRGGHPSTGQETRESSDTLHDSSTLFNPSYPTFDTISDTRIPLCLISTWENGPLPPFAISMIHSLKQNEGFAKLFLFHHQGGYAAEHLNDHFNTSFVQVVNVAELKDTYVQGGMTRFAADRVCEIHNISITSKTCDKLYYAMRWSNYRGENSPPIVQLRGMFGRIFEQWVNPAVCDAWAWTDLDIVFGNIKGFLDQQHTLVWDNHVFTVSGLDWENVYTRGQLTVHIQNNNKSDSVNSIWRYCDVLNSVDALALALAEGNKGFCMDEGCYAKAVILSGVVFSIFPWQGNVWDLRHSLYAAHVGGSLYITSGCADRLACRRHVAQDFQHVTNTEMISLSSQVSEWHPFQFVTDQPQCMWWIDRKYQTCIQSPQLPDSVRHGQAAWGLLVDKGNVSMWTWNLPREESGLDKVNATTLYDDLVDRPMIRTHWYDFSRVEQVLFFHFTEWKHLLSKGLDPIPTNETLGNQADMLLKWVKSLSWDSSTGKVFEMYDKSSRIVSFGKWSEA